MRTRLAGTVGLCGLLLAACSSGAPSSTNQTTVTSSASVATPTTTAQSASTGTRLLSADVGLRNTLLAFEDELSSAVQRQTVTPALIASGAQASQGIQSYQSVVDAIAWPVHDSTDVKTADAQAALIEGDLDKFYSVSPSTLALWLPTFSAHVIAWTTATNALRASVGLSSLPTGVASGRSLSVGEHPSGS